MLALDPSNALQHYPMAMSKFGLNPHGENLFRLVQASSRRSIVFGQWNGAGTPRAQYCKTYPGVTGWILEEWVDAFTFTGGVTAEMWNSDPALNVIGAYPSRGEYQMCGNTSFDPHQTNIEKLITLVHAGDRYSWAQKLAACRDSAARDEAGKASKVRDIIQDAFPAFGHAPFTAYGGKGGGRKSAVQYSAHELGLPVPRGTPGHATAGGSMTIPKRKRRKAA